MDENVKAILASPYSWLFGIGVAALLGVWWAKMTPTTSNITLVVGVVAITASAFLHPWISTQPPLVRWLWTLATVSCLGLAVYYTLWSATDSGSQPLASSLPKESPQDAVAIAPSDTFTLRAGGFSGTVPLVVTNTSARPVFAVFIVITTNNQTQSICEQMDIRLDDDPEPIVTDSSGIGIKRGDVLFVELASPTGTLRVVFDELLPGRPRRIWLVGKGPPMVTVRARVESASDRPTPLLRPS
jgi:hypothetical protein